MSTDLEVILDRLLRDIRQIVREEIAQALADSKRATRPSKASRDTGEPPTVY